MKIPCTPKPLSIRHTSRIISSPEAPDDRIMGLFSLEGASDAMALNDFDQEELITSLISKMRSADSEISLPATGLFWKITKDIASANGKFTKQQVTQPGTTPNGKALTLTSSRTVLSSPAPSFVSGAFTAPLIPTPLSAPEPADPLPTTGGGETQPSPGPSPIEDPG